MLNILLVIVSIMAMIVGTVVFLCNRRTNSRMSAVSFSIAIFGTAFWVLFVQLFQTAPTEDLAELYLKLFSISALLVPIGCLSYSMTLLKGRVVGKIMTILVCVLCVGASMFIANDINALASVAYSPGQNIVGSVASPLFPLYGAIIGVFQTIAILTIFTKSLKSKDSNKKFGLIWLGAGLVLSTVLSGVFNLVMPIIGHLDLFWVGPFSISITMLFIYFATLKYKLFVNTSKHLRFATYMILVAMAALAYICLFYLIFMLLFRGANPSNEIMIFQFIMVVIVILFLPTINHFIEYVKGMIADNGAITEAKEDDSK